MIITLKICQVNFKKRLPQEIQVFSEEELREFLAQGAVIKKNKQYHLIIHYRQLVIQCPILLTPEGQYQLIWPSFKLPNRPYPIYVYLYALAWYLSSGESMRVTAEKVLNVFGLETFSHTTISRFLRKIYLTLPYLISYGAQIIKDWGLTTAQVIRRKHWDDAHYEKAQQLNGLLNPVLRSPPEFGNWLADQYWQDTQNFII
ncbi:MAG: hypothetical protein M0021_07070 [Clostridia bacterium]|nr:hypothetical protein [Clostridia bacterium]